MTRLKIGDTVRIPAVEEGTIVDEYRPGVFQVRTLGQSGDTLISAGALKLVEPADDPSKYPVGTLRLGPNTELVVKSDVDDSQHWQTVMPNTAAVYYLDHEVVGWEPAGAVPGTPAAEAQKPREPWTGDGSEEPPAHVTMVRDGVGDIAQRVAGQWDWVKIGTNLYETQAHLSWPWETLKRNPPYTEVLPE